MTCNDGVIVVAFSNFYSNGNNYKVIYNKKYEVKLCRPVTGTLVHNIFTGNIERTSTYKPFMVVGPLGDETIVSWKELSSDYETTDGRPVEAILNEIKPNKDIKLVYKNVNQKYFATLVPYRLENVKILDILCNIKRIPLNGSERICLDFEKALANEKLRDGFRDNYVGTLRPGSESKYDYIVPHSTGDYVVCDSLPDGSGPDLNTARCVNGSLFEQCYDMRYISSISINLFSILLDIELKKQSYEGFKLMKRYQTNSDKGKLEYKFNKDESLANEYYVSFKLGVNNKLGILHCKLNKESKNISCYVECLGQKVSLMNYDTYKTKYIEICKQKGIKQMNDLELLVRYVEKVVTDSCNLIYGAELQISKEAEKLSNLLIENVKRMFKVLGQGSVRLDKDEDKNEYRVYTTVYAHDLYGIESRSAIRIKMEDCSVEAFIFDNNTKRAVPLVSRCRIQNDNNIREFINAYKSNLLQVVSGSAFNK